MWWVAIFLEALLLVRGLQQKLAATYPVFYAYIFFVFIEELLRFYAYRWHPGMYAEIYWITQYLAFVIGSVVVFEIYRIGLAAFPGAARVARNLLLLVFTAIYANALLARSQGVLGWPVESPYALERNLRIAQASAVIVLVALFLRYAIPFGRNLKGILLGYSFFIAASVVQLTFFYYFRETIQHPWSYLQPGSYLVVLGIWVKALWSYEPTPGTTPAIQLEHDYQTLMAATNRRIQRARNTLGMAARS